MLTPTLNLPTITQEVALNTIRFNRNLGFIQGRIAAFGKAMADVGVSISLAVSIPLQLMAASAVKSFADLEHAATRAASRVGGDFQGLRDQIMTTAQVISTRVPMAASEIVEGIEELIKAGANAEFAMASIEHLAQMAASGPMALGEAVSSVTDVFFALGMATGDAQKDLMGIRRVTDVIAKSADISKASYASMNQAFVTGAPVAKTFNLTLEESAAILAAYSQAGIKGADAGTKLRQVLMDITDASLEHADTWEKVLGPGAVYDQVSGQMKDLADIIDTLQGAATGLTEEGQRELFRALEIPKRSFHATSAMFGLSRSIRDFRQEIEQAGGHVQTVFAKQMESFSNQIKILRNNLNIVAVDIGKRMVPTLGLAIDKVRVLFQWWTSLSDAVREQIIMWAGLAAAMGPALILFSFAARVIGLIVGLLTAGGPIGAFLAVIVGYLAFVSDKFPFIVKVLKSIGLVVYETLRGFMELGQHILSLFNLVLMGLDKIVGFVDRIFGGTLESMSVQFDAEFKKISNSAMEMWKSIINPPLDANQILAKDIENLVRGGFMSPTEGARLLAEEGLTLPFDLQMKVGPDVEKLLKDLEGLESGFAAQNRLAPGDEDFQFTDDEDQKQTASGIQQFSASELGSVEEAAARAKGQNQLVTIGQHQLQEQKKTNIKIDLSNKKLEDIDSSVKNFGNFKEANV